MWEVGRWYTTRMLLFSFQKWCRP